MNYILFVYFAIYILVIVATARKLRDILKNPDKYQEDDMDRLADERIKKKKHFGFFKSLSHQYAFVPLFMSFAFSGIGAILIRTTIKLVAGNNNLIIPETWLISAVALLFINFSFGMVVVPMHIKNSFFAVAMDEMGATRYRTWKSGYIMFLISFILLFPFCGLAANNYVYYDADGITSSRYFELGETYKAYEDVTAVEIYHRYDSDNELTFGYTVTLSDGKTFDMVPSDLFSGDIYKLHKMFEKKAQCIPKITPLTDEVRDELKEYVSPERLEEIEYVFDGFHK